MSDYTPQEYPKWVGDVIVNSRAEERALAKAAKAEPAQTFEDRAAQIIETGSMSNV